VDEKMAICDNCKKTPLEYGEINEVHRGNEEVILCDECYKMIFLESFCER